MAAKESPSFEVSASPDTTRTAKPASMKNGDAALELLISTGDLKQPTDPKRIQRLLQRIKHHIMPLICTVYFLQYLDNTSISYASVTGFRESAHLVGDQFKWVASIFFFGHLTFEFPTIYILQMFPLAKYSFASLMVCRFFLGAAEATIVPACVVFTSQSYKKEEQAFRVGIWLSICRFSQMFGGHFAYGVGRHVGGDVHAALKGWQIIF
ncbi:uncharacterized protein A1O5_10894 [Cladophialophora psammophila CBS 110553]|uniref:Major facilitator superfamily (MFS) profile domain-containing protein n=1 Tax=Cladophialophora psammophila CBS 110553 TaxID=1182543 RepID=W9WDB6_9EURO|nr:uncharacterized protein A1O5_10894 [Cladophialophora psammophila CBS 110553]EXJ65918.1 hypothetical protein A1O5_10894 [Cladophialophora psammophila CBS 110553]